MAQHRLLAALGLCAVLIPGLPACKKTAPGTCSARTYSKSIDSFLPYESVGQLVNPLMGSTNGGNVVPGALVPHGVVKLSPDTNQSQGSLTSYDYGASAIEGFSHTHLEGPGGSNYGYEQVLVVPTRGAIATTAAGYQSAFDHSTEVAQPGYYAVDLATPDVRAELTATRLCGVHRYTFNESGSGNILIDLAHTQGQLLSGHVSVIGGSEIQGSATYQVDPLISFTVSTIGDTPAGTTTSQRTVYFDARFSRPFDSFGTWQDGVAAAGSTTASSPPMGAYATYASAGAAPVELQVCLSAISEAQAVRNYQEEVSGQSFDQVRAAAADSWNRILNRVQVEGGTPAQQQTFYSALYHTFFQPADYTEDCQFWSGEDGVGTVLPASGWDYFTDDWCMWDTYRTTHPLQLLLEPEHGSDMVRSIMVGYERAGWMNRCSWEATGDSRVMVAIPFASIIADAYSKGFRDYDTGQAWDGLWKAATQEDPAALVPGLCGYMNKGTPPDYLKLGYVPHECDANQSASMTLEYAYEDWALSNLADGLGKTAERDQLRSLAESYRNVFNPASGFMQGRHADGSWVEPFDPTSGKDFTEDPSWVYTWLVPHDEAGLVGLLGGPAAYVARLDAYFTGGHHDPSNEPGFETPYLYDYGGAPAKTQAQIRALLAQSFSATPGGLPGNDDSGAMSSYFVWGALGLYPISPGDDTYLIGSPLFDKATIYLEPNFYGGKTFVIQTAGNGPAAPYIQSATLNGAPLTQPWIHFQDVVSGGSLVLQMGATPSSWGTAAADAPPSM